MSEKPLKFQQIDWWPVQQSIVACLHIRLADDKKLGMAVSYAEGKEFIRQCASDILHSIRIHLEEQEADDRP